MSDMLQLVGEIHKIQAMILLVCPTLENSTSRQAEACRTLMRQVCHCPEKGSASEEPFTPSAYFQTASLPKASFTVIEQTLDLQKL